LPRFIFASEYFLEESTPKRGGLAAEIINNMIDLPIPTGFRLQKRRKTTVETIESDQNSI
jgi:hypothetical protein